MRKRKDQRNAGNILRVYIHQHIMDVKVAMAVVVAVAVMVEAAMLVAVAVVVAVVVAR